MDAWNLRSLQMIIAYVWAFLISKGDTRLLDLSCPELFVEGSNLVICQVKSTHFINSVMCGFNVSSKIVFNYVINKSISHTLCETPNGYITNQCNSSDIAVNNESNSTCYCLQGFEKDYTYVLNFQAFKTKHAGATVNCITCFPEEEDMNIETTCRNINFDPQMTRELTTVTAPPRPKVKPKPATAAPVRSAASTSRIGLECAWMAWVILVSLIGQVSLPMVVDASSHHGPESCNAIQRIQMGI